MFKALNRIFVFTFILIALAGCSSANDSLEQLAADVATINQDSKSTGIWYVGGNLHDKTAIDWQKASYHNKRATCADYLVALQKSGQISNKLNLNYVSNEGLKPMAEKLVKDLNRVFEMTGTAQQNEEMFGDRKISSEIVKIAQFYQWIKVEKNS